MASGRTSGQNCPCAMIRKVTWTCLSLHDAGVHYIKGLFSLNCYVLFLPRLFVQMTNKIKDKATCTVLTLYFIMILSFFVLLYDCQLTICQLTDSKPGFFDNRQNCQNCEISSAHRSTALSALDWNCITISCTVILLYVLAI